MLSTIPFEIPAQLLPAVWSGDLVRFGSILKDAGTGKIVAHLQETGVAQSLISSAISGLPTPLSAVTDLINVGSGIYTSMQVAQLKAMMGTLQALQVASIGVSLVGVGVSVAGFVYMRKRFNQLDGRLDEVIKSIQTGFDDQRMSAMRGQLSRAKGLILRAEHAATLTDSRYEYTEVAAALADQSAYFEGEIEFLVSVDGQMDLALLWQLAQSLMLCNSVRIDCRIRVNELKNAMVISESVASKYQDLFSQITPVSFKSPVQEGLATVRVLRDATDSAASKPYLIDYLRTSRISGEQYVEALDREKENALLLLRES